MKLTTTQAAVIEELKKGNIIHYFKGFGNRISPSASLNTKDGNQIRSISTATFRALRHKHNLLVQTNKDPFHAYFKLKTTT